MRIISRVYKGLPASELERIATDPNWDRLIGKPKRMKNGDYIYCTEPYADKAYRNLYNSEGRVSSMSVENNVGDIIVGEVVSINKSFVILEARGKSQIYCPVRYEHDDVLESLSIGMEVDFMVTDIQYKPTFMIEGNISKIWKSKITDELCDKLVNSNITVTMKIKTWIPSGYSGTFEVDGIDYACFLPATLAGINRSIDPQDLVDAGTLDVCVESYSEDNGNWIVSRKKYLGKLADERTEKLIPNQTYVGKVTGVAKFGVFVEFDEVLTGMIHKVNLYPEHQDIFMEKYSIGDDIEFFVKEVVNKKIILSQIQRDSIWDSIGNGKKYNGVIKETKDFGTLVILDEETMGLIRQNEFDKLGMMTPAPGTKINVQVITVQRENRKIYLRPVLKVRDIEKNLKK
jgi:ribosomal protein S1